MATPAATGIELVTSGMSDTEVPRQATSDPLPLCVTTGMRTPPNVSPEVGNESATRITPEGIEPVTTGITKSEVRATPGPPNVIARGPEGLHR